MQKWEYCRLLYDGTSRDYWHILYKPEGHVTLRVRRDEAKGDKDDTSAWWRMIAELGLDGWELATSYEDSHGSHHLYFTRPLS